MDAGDRVNRRTFLKFGGMTLVVSAIDPGFARAVGHPGLERLRHAAPSGKTLIYIFQRFGCDGLNVAVPIEAGEYATYQKYRPSLQIPMAELVPQQLDANFALSPVTKKGLYALWQQGMVAVLPSVGYPDASRSHFDSQLFVDNGTPFQRTTPDGWLNRYLQTAPVSGEPMRAVFTSVRPFSLAGRAPAVSFTDLTLDAMAVAPTNPIRDQEVLDTQGQVYALSSPGRSYDAELAAEGQGLVAAIAAIRKQPLPAAGPGYPNTPFGSSLRQLGQLLKSKRFAVEIAEVDIGGWDTHSQQQLRSDEGVFPGLLSQLSDGIKALIDDLNAADPALMRNTVVLTASEFGRTARENGNRWTDHGGAWLSFVVGDANVVRGGKTYFGPGGWRSLTELREDRDLNYSLDYRDVFSEVLSKHLGTLDPSIFPGWKYRPIGFL